MVRVALGLQKFLGQQLVALRGRRSSKSGGQEGDLNSSGSVVYRVLTTITEELLHPVVPHTTSPTVDLNAVAGGLIGKLGEEALKDGSHQRHLSLQFCILASLFGSFGELHLRILSFSEFKRGGT